MPTLAHSHIPTPKSWEEFEDIALSAAKVRWRHSSFLGNGRIGQEQNGIDIYGTDENDNLLGIQCKNTVDGVTKETIAAETLAPV
jgi:predicted helicase